MSSLRVDLHDPSSSAAFTATFPALHARWPYLLGAIAGPVYGASALVLLIATHTRGQAGEGAARLALLAAVIGGALLGIAWLALLRRGHGGAAPIAGSLALPLALSCVWLGGSGPYLSTTAMLIAGALAAFGWGHAVAPGLVVLRALAAGSALLWTLAFVGIARDWPLPPSLLSFAFLATALTGICLACSFLSLRYAPRPRW